jgi:hypothetical protein
LTSTTPAELIERAFHDAREFLDSGGEGAAADPHARAAACRLAR